MRALVRRGLLVLLDLTNSSRELLLRPRKGVGEIDLARAVSRLAYAFAQQEAETVAFTGDGLLAFLPDTGRPQWLSWALTDALRDALHSTATNSLRQGVPVALRIAVDYGEALQVLDGPFAGHFVGRSVARLEDIANAARPAENDPRVPASALVTEQVRQLLGLRPTPQLLSCAPDSRHFSCRERFCLWEMPYPTTRAHQPPPETMPPPVVREGIVVCLGLSPAPGGPIFPPLHDDYLAVMGDLVQLVALCGAEVISLTPTAVFGFIEPVKSLAQHLADVNETLFSSRGTTAGAVRDARGLLARAHRRGWHGLRLAAGLAHGPLFQLVNGPLTGQSIGRPVVLASRYALVAERHLQPDDGAGICMALPWRDGAQSLADDRAGATRLWSSIALLNAGGAYYAGSYGHGAQYDDTGSLWGVGRSGSPAWSATVQIAPLAPDDAKNLHWIGYREALLLRD